MKKILLTLLVAVAATTANAQWYVGGSLGIGSVTNKGGDSKSTYKIVPEVGYNLNDAWAVGVALGYQKGAAIFGNGEDDFVQNVETEAFAVSPYARYTFLKSNLLNVFVDGGVTFASYKDYGTNFQVGLRPGVALNLSKSVSLVAHIGFIGYNSFSYKADGVDNSNSFGLDYTGTASTFGVYYNF